MRRFIFFVAIIAISQSVFAQEGPVGKWLTQANDEIAKVEDAYQTALRQYEKTENKKFIGAINAERSAMDSMKYAVMKISDFRGFEAYLMQMGRGERVRFVVFGKKVQGDYTEYADMYLEALQHVKEQIMLDGSASNDATILAIEPMPYPYDMAKMSGWHFRYRITVSKK